MTFKEFLERANDITEKYPNVLQKDVISIYKDEQSRHIQFDIKGIDYCCYEKDFETGEPIFAITIY